MGSSTYPRLYTCVGPTVRGLLVSSKQLPSHCLPRQVPARLLPGRAGPRSHAELRLMSSPEQDSPTQKHPSHYPGAGIYASTAKVQSQHRKLCKPTASWALLWHGVAPAQIPALEQ